MSACTTSYFGEWRKYGLERRCKLRVLAGKEDHVIERFLGQSLCDCLHIVEIVTENARDGYYIK